MKLECRFCHEDLSLLAPEANVWRHQSGLCSPSRNEVDAAITELEEAEKRRTQRALEFVNAQRPHQVVTGKSLLKFFGWVVFWSVLGYAFVVGWMGR